MASASASNDALNALRDAIADAVEARVRTPAVAQRVAKAIEGCLCFHLLPSGGLSVAHSLWRVLEGVDWTAQNGLALPSGPMPDQPLVALVRQAGLLPDDAQRSWQWIILCLEAHLILPACAHLCSPACAPLVAAHYSPDSIVREHDSAARFLALLSAAQGVPFPCTAALMARPVTPANLGETNASAPPSSSTRASSGQVATPPHAKHKDEELFLSPGHAPLHAFWDDLTVAAEASANTGMHHHGVVLESLASPVPRVLSEAQSRLRSPSSILGVAASTLPAHLLLLPPAMREVSAGDHEQPLPPVGHPAAAPAISSWDFAGSLSSMLSFPFDAVRRLLGTSDVQPRQPQQPSHGSVFGVPLEVVVRDPFHCVHAALDYRLAVPELVHACGRMLKDLARAASPGSASAPRGLGIVSPPVADVLALAAAWDATRSLPLPMASQAGSRGGASSAGSDLVGRSDDALAPWELRAHTISQLLRYYVLRLPRRPISSEQSSLFAACGDAACEAGAGQEAALASPRARRLRAFVNDLPVEVRGLLCELLPLLGWMCGVSPDGVGCGGDPAVPLTLFNEAHLSALSHMWAAALVAPPINLLSSPTVSASPIAVPESFLSSNLESHVRGSVAAVACLIVSWRYCLEDAMEERSVWERALLRRLHRLTVTHYMLCSLPMSDDPPGLRASSSPDDGSSCSLESATNVPDGDRITPRAPFDSATVVTHQGSVLDGEKRSISLTATTLHFHATGVGAQRSSVPGAQVLLKRLWHSLRQAVAVVTKVEIETGCQPTGPFWRSVGFQSGDPMVDASRSRSRALGLLCMAYMSEEFQLQVWTILARMHGNEHAALAWATASTARTHSDNVLPPQAIDDATGGSAAGRRSFFPFASCILLIVRRLAEALHFHGTRGHISEATGGATATLDADRLSARVSAKGHRVFSPLVVATLHPDLWVLTAADDASDPFTRGESVPLRLEHWQQPSLSTDSTAIGVNEVGEQTLLSTISISAAFAKTVCLAAFILEERWRTRSSSDSSGLSQLVVLAVHDSLALLPVISAIDIDPSVVAEAAGKLCEAPQAFCTRGFDVLAAFSMWRRHSGAALADGGSAGRVTMPKELAAAKADSQLFQASALSPADRAVASSADTVGYGVLSAYAAPLTSRSSILSDSQAVALHRELPKALQSYEWVCVYDLLKHGASLPTLLQRSRDNHFSLFVVSDTLGGVFGGFTGDSWNMGLSSGRYFGSGQSFVFTFEGGREAFNAWRNDEVAADLAEEHAAIVATLREDPHSASLSSVAEKSSDPPPSVTLGTTGPVLSVYRWSRRNRYFQLAGPDGVGMGGGGSFAWFLDGSLCLGSSGLCGTFLSPCLSAEGDRFTAVRVELWALRRRSTSSEASS